MKGCERMLIKLSLVYAFLAAMIFIFAVGTLQLKFLMAATLLLFFAVMYLTFRLIGVRYGTAPEIDSDEPPKFNTKDL
jgi:Ca2+/Na+ antiporter